MSYAFRFFIYDARFFELFNVHIVGGVYIFVLFLSMSRAIVIILSDIVHEINMLYRGSIVILVTIRDPNIGATTFLARRRLGWTTFFKFRV